jgi:hypothetical protein
VNSTISLKDIFGIIFPFLLLILFIKSFISSFFLFYPGDITFAFVITILTFKDSGILLYSLLALLGLLEGFDFLENEILVAVYFISLGIIWRYLRKYFSFERLETKMFIWFLSIISFLIFRYIVFFSKLNVSINWLILLNLAVKSFYYICTTYIWTLVFNKILAEFFTKKHEKF